MATFCNWTIGVVTILIAALTAVYLFLKRTYSFWDRRGIKSIPNASLLFGHFRETILQREHIGHVVTRLYRQSSEPFVGIYTVLCPILLVRDTTLAHSILVKDFAHFSERGIHCNEDYDPLSGIVMILKKTPSNATKHKKIPYFRPSVCIAHSTLEETTH